MSQFLIQKILDPNPGLVDVNGKPKNDTSWIANEDISSWNYSRRNI
jgi:hypothetical protein